jgi:hypothetical protein
LDFGLSAAKLNGFESFDHFAALNNLIEVLSRRDAHAISNILYEIRPVVITLDPPVV